MAVVELQQFCFGQGDDSDVAHEDCLDAVAAAVSGMGEPHGPDYTDRDPLN
jgi:hypothetical protein